MQDYRSDEAPPRRPIREAPVLDTETARARAHAAWDKGEALARAGHLAAGLAWLGRAHRMAPGDQNLAFALAFLRLQSGDAEGAAALFSQMAASHDVRECWAGLAAARLRQGLPDQARQAAQRALSRHTADASIAGLAAELTRFSHLPGWCGLRDPETLVIGGAAEPPSFQLDGAALELTPIDAQTWRLPHDAIRASRLAVTASGAALLGSPLQLDAIFRLEGFVERTGTGVAGWAWYPGMPETDPILTIGQVAETGHIIAQSRVSAQSGMGSVEGTRPLSRPRAFAEAAPPDCDVRVTDEQGRHLLGSPLLAGIVAAPQGEPDVAMRAEPDLPVDVIVPVYRGLQTTMDCLATLLQTVHAPHRIVVVNDRTPEAALAAALSAMAAAGRIHLIETGASGSFQGSGFPAAANAGLRHAAGRHAILLNSDTLVAPGWLETLRDAACSARSIGTATPLSNEASIFSYPKARGGNTAPDAAETRSLAALAASANAGRLVDVPTAHGFCMFIRHDCLAATGLLEQRLFAQGYGEENDFCERARALGYRHVAVPAVFVAHRGGVSFGGAGQDLLRRNQALLRARHPDYLSRVAAFIDGDALWPARRRLDAARWQAGLARNAAPRGAVLLVTHGGGGGTTRIVAERTEALRADGFEPVVLRPVNGACEVGDGEGGTPNLAYVLPRELPRLRQLMGEANPVAAEIHHLLGHDHAVMRMIAGLGIPYDAWVHDYAWFCGRIAFVTAEGRFCGEAPPPTCEICLKEGGRSILDPIGPAALRRRSAGDLRAASRVIVPSADVARRVARHVPGLVAEIRPWEHVAPRRHTGVLHAQGARRVAIVGAIGLEKGFRVLLSCAEDAALRRLPLEFVVIGYTEDDEALMQTGRVFVTGEFSRAEASGLIARQEAQLAFLPSIWPETWCYALSDVWLAGLSAAVFDIGTPAERVRAQGGGWVLPLGLPPSRVNDVLLSLV